MNNNLFCDLVASSEVNAKMEGIILFVNKKDQSNVMEEGWKEQLVRCSSRNVQRDSSLEVEALL